MVSPTLYQSDEAACLADIPDRFPKMIGVHIEVTFSRQIANSKLASGNMLRLIYSMGVFLTLRLPR